MILWSWRGVARRASAAAWTSERIGFCPLQHTAIKASAALLPLQTHADRVCVIRVTHHGMRHDANSNIHFDGYSCSDKLVYRLEYMHRIGRSGCAAHSPRISGQFVPERTLIAAQRIYATQ